MFRYTILIAVLCGLTTTAYGQQYYYGEPEPYYQQRPHYRIVPVIPQPYYAPAPQPQYAYPQEQYDQDQYAPQRYGSSDLSRKCALASEYLKHNNCGPQGCDEGYCLALQNGCRINSWGHNRKCQ